MTIEYHQLCEFDKRFVLKKFYGLILVIFLYFVVDVTFVPVIVMFYSLEMLP